MFFKILMMAMSLELGYMGGGVYQYQPEVKLHESHSFYAKLDAEVSAGPFFAGGSVDTYVFPHTWTSFDPYQVTFGFNTGLRFGGVEVGWRHSCFHPLITYATLWDGQITPFYEGGFDQFYVKFVIKSR